MANQIKIIIIFKCLSRNKQAFKGLLNHLDAKTNVDAGGIIKAPAETYTSKERFDLEWDSFFQDYPQIIGMSGDLAEPNSFITIEDFGQLLPLEMLMVILKLCQCMFSSRRSNRN